MWVKRETKNPEPVVFAAAIQGNREEQQDSFRVFWLESERSWLLVVADGMGGHASGGLASKIAADHFVTSFETLRRQGAALKEALFGAVNAVNASLAEAQHADARTAGMGTTLVAGHLSYHGIAWISIGDSPLWLYRKGAIHRLNEDHSLRNTPGIVDVSRNMLQSALNGQPLSLVDCHPEPVPIENGDIVLVGSDGLLTLSEQFIASTIEKTGTPNPELLTWLLLHAVEDKEQIKQDNCSLIVARPMSAPKASRFTLTKIAKIFKVAALIMFAVFFWFFR